MAAGANTPAPTGEAGSALIEALVSAVILLVAIVALFLALDVQTRASGDNRSASAAASVAEADQERLRSFRVSDLAKLREAPHAVVVAGISYTVDSQVDLIRDATGGTQGCQSSSTQAEYLRLTTTVTVPSGSVKGPAPIVLRSLVAPPVGEFGPGQGTLAVSVVGGAGQPVQGLPVTVTGPKTLTDTTNAAGCVIFNYIPVGSYQVQATAGGFADPAGNLAATGSATVTEGTVSLTPLTYDRSGSATVTFDTKVGSAAPQASTSRSITVANSGVPATGSRPFPVPSTTTPSATIQANSLFPFSSPYAIYSGSCTAANPALYDASYFSRYPGSLAVAPGSSAAITVREPALRLTLNSSPYPYLPVHVRAKSTDTGCTEVFDWNVTTDGSATATLPDPGLPFGHYSICADSYGYRTATPLLVPLTDPAGSAAVTLYNNSTVAGNCP